MEQKQKIHYENLTSYAQELHEKNKKRVKASGIVLVLLPVVLGLIRWLTDSDKAFFLMLWILGMFLISAYLVSVEYLDHMLQKRLRGITGSDGEDESLLPGRGRAPSDDSAPAEEGGDA